MTYRVVIPASWERQTKTLLRRMFWCLGRDIEQPDNLLVRFGFARLQQSYPRMALTRSRYRRTCAQGTLYLWPQALACGQPGGTWIYCPRTTLSPLCAEEVQIEAYHSVFDSFPTLWEPATYEAAHRLQQQTQVALQELYGYEAWVQRHSGEAYRQQVLDACPLRMEATAADAYLRDWREVMMRYACWPIEEKLDAGDIETSADTARG